MNTVITDLQEVKEMPQKDNILTQPLSFKDILLIFHYMFGIDASIHSIDNDIINICYENDELDIIGDINDNNTLHKIIDNQLPKYINEKQSSAYALGQLNIKAAFKELLGISTPIAF